MKLSYNKGHTKKFVQRRKHATGRNYARMIIDAGVFEKDGNDNLMVWVSSQALRDPNDPRSLVAYTELRDFFTLPLDNPEAPGHTIADDDYAQIYARSWTDFAAAVFPDEVAAPPRRQEVDASGKGVGPYFFKGEEIEASDYEICLEEATESAGVKSVEVYKDPKAALVGRGYFCHILEKEAKDGRKFVNQVAYRSELPDWWELETEIFVETEGGSQTEKPTKGGRRMRKAAKKSVTKTRG